MAGLTLGDLKIYPKIYEIACRHTVSSENSPYLDINKIKLLNAFAWGSTSLKSTFWAYLYNNKIDEAKELHPELFEESYTEKLGVTIKANGLWD